MKGDIKTVVLTALGVMVAGYVMNMMYDVAIVKQASDGFDK
ncbi:MULTISPECIES: hypothetical protein [Thalassospira]|nr:MULTISPECIES: hypothetical protein [Thalassospira]